jgi:hypothetical protein
MSSPVRSTLTSLDPNTINAVRVALATAKRLSHKAMAGQLETKLALLIERDNLSQVTIKCLDDAVSQPLVTSPLGASSMSEGERLSLSTSPHWQTDDAAEEEK